MDHPHIHLDVTATCRADSCERGTASHSNRVPRPLTCYVSTDLAQTLARHGDIRLTLGLDTHVEIHDRAASLEVLP